MRPARSRMSVAPRLRVLASLALMLASALAVAGCQLGGDAAGKPRFGYSLLYDQNDQLRALLDRNDLQAANELYVKEQAFFAANEAKATPTLASFAAKVNETYEPRATALSAKLADLGEPDDERRWSGAKETLAAAQGALDEYNGFRVVAEGRYRSAKLDALKAQVEAVTASYEARAVVALPKFSGFSQTDFFAVYPVRLDEQRVFAATLPAILSRLQASSSAEVLSVARLYAAAAGEDKTQSALRRAFIRSWLHEQGSAIDPATLAAALDSLTAIGGTARPGDSAGMAVLMVTTKAGGRAEVDVDVEEGLPLPVRRIDASAVEQELRALDYAVVIRVKTARLVRNLSDSQTHPSTYIVGYRMVRNPDYEAAQLRVAQAQSNLNSVRLQNAINTQQATTLLGGLTQSLNQGSAQLELQRAMAALQRTPPTIRSAVYAEYEYTTASVAERKQADIEIDLMRRGGAARRFSLPLEEEQNFSLAYNVHDKDPDRSSILASAQPESAASAWEKAPLRLALPQVLAGLSGSPGETGGLASLHAATAAAERGDEAAAEPASREAKRAHDRRFDSVVIVRTVLGLGAGFFVRPDVILTNRHVAGGSAFANIETFDGQKVTGKVIAVDTRLDLALVQVPLDGPPVTFAKPSDIAQGMAVEAIGHPKGLFFSISKGIVSALRTVDGVTYIQTDTSLNHGNSGGPLFLGQEVVGVNTWGMADAQNLNFAIDFREAQRFIGEHL